MQFRASVQKEEVEVEVEVEDEKEKDAVVVKDGELSVDAE
jgi:hypothetical protein